VVYSVAHTTFYKYLDYSASSTLPSKASKLIKNVSELTEESGV